MKRESDKSFVSKLHIDVKRFAKYFVYMVLLLIIFYFLSSIFQGKRVFLFGTYYNLEIFFIIVFVLIFSPIIGVLVRDTAKILDYISKFVIKKFPGMEEDMTPITKIFRDIVYIIILFLMSPIVMPLFRNLIVFKINLTYIVSFMFFTLLLFFIYDIFRQILKITKGQFKIFEKKLLSLIRKINKLK